MFKRLQQKWEVTPLRLLLILVTFAVGGSLTGILGRKVMQWIHVESTVLYIPVYIIIVTLIWPLMVLVVSIPFGQFFFFRKYLRKMGQRMRIGRSKKKDAGELLPDFKLSKDDETPVKKNIILFASGAGSNAQKIIDHFRNSTHVKVSLIVCNKPGAGVVDIGRSENIPVLIIDRDRFFRGDGFIPEIEKAGPDLIVLAGFLWKIPQALIDQYRGKIINIHPALLPKYGGKGMYGHYVHEAVLSAGEVQSGITIHYVDEHYDSGDIIFQTACPVMEGDTAKKLAERIQMLEHVHYPRVVEEVLRKGKI